MLDLVDVGVAGAGFSYRRLGVILRQLPRDSATRREVIGEEEDWSISDYLQAALIDAVQGWGWMQVGSKKVPKPTPIRRPGEKPARTNRTQLSSTEITDRLLEQQRRRG